MIGGHEQSIFERDLRAADQAEALARRMDSAFRIPLTQIRLGWDSIFGLIPGVGDTLTLAPTVYIMQLAHRTGAPKITLVRMLGNAGVDWAIGLVPLLGDVLDVGYKSNIRNAGLLRAHVTKKHEGSAAVPPASSTRRDIQRHKAPKPVSDQ